MSGKNKFIATRWSLVSMVRRGGSEGTKALNTLIEIYWFPLYAFSRSTGRSQEDAQDLVQGFYLNLIEHSSIEQLDKNGGKLRTFLIKAFKNYCASDLRKKYAQKRGGGELALSLDDAESKYQVQGHSNLSPEALYDRAWALALLNSTMLQLEEYYAARDKRELYHELKVYLGWEKGEETYGELAIRIGKSVSAIKSEVRRLKLKYKQFLTEQVQHTLELTNDEDVNAELMELLGCVG